MFTIGPYTLCVLGGSPASTTSTKREMLKDIVNVHEELLEAAALVAFEAIQAAEYAGEEIPDSYIRLQEAVAKAREF
jgi:hypothetical protein